MNSPSLNSPKFPHPIFFPTRKFGPTISTPEELTECRAGYIPLAPRAAPLPPPATPPPAPPPVAPPEGGAPLCIKNEKQIKY